MHNPSSYIDVFCQKIAHFFLHHQFWTDSPTTRTTTFLFYSILSSVTETDVIILKLNQAISNRLLELLDKQGITQYRLYLLSGVPRSTINNIVLCAYDSVKLRIIHELCQGLNINISDFFNSPLFDEENLEP